MDYYSIKEWYYLHSAPVYNDREKYNLTGDGHKWSHSTMSSEKASEMKQYMYQSIKNVLYTDPDMGLWYLVYMRVRGHTWDQINGYQSLINSITTDNNNGVYGVHDVLIEDVKGILVA